MGKASEIVRTAKEWAADIIVIGPTAFMILPQDATGAATSRSSFVSFAR